MKKLKQFTAAILVLTLFFNSTVAYAEALDDKFTNIVPGKSQGGNEHVHGAGYGKILMRVMMFGAVPSQGVHYMPEGTDLLFAMLFAGGYSDESKIDSITIRRRGQPDLIQIDLEEILEKGEKIPRLADGDILTVPFNWKKDIATIGLITGFITATTGFALSLVALSR